MGMKDSGECKDGHIRGDWELVQGLWPMLKWDTAVCSPYWSRPKDRKMDWKETRHRSLLTQQSSVQVETGIEKSTRRKEKENDRRNRQGQDLSPLPVNSKPSTLHMGT